MSFSFFPLPSCSPTNLLRLCLLIHVTIKSPMPERPEKVSGLAPRAIPRREISAIPRVMMAALVLSPNFAPSIIPAPIAITFLMHPHIQHQECL